MSFPCLPAKCVVLVAGDVSFCVREFYELVSLVVCVVEYDALGSGELFGLADQIIENIVRIAGDVSRLIRFTSNSIEFVVYEYYKFTIRVGFPDLASVVVIGIRGCDFFLIGPDGFANRDESPSVVGEPRLVPEFVTDFFESSERVVSVGTGLPHRIRSDEEISVLIVGIFRHECGSGFSGPPYVFG